MTALFKDTYLQNSFDSKGYVTIPFFSESQVNGLLDLYYRYINAVDISGLYESSRNNSPGVNEIINNSISEIIKENAENIFVPCTIYGGTFMVKSHSDSEMLPLHQDWSVVEEDLYNTIFIWCPLVNVSSLNGGLFVLEGSHKYFDCIRSGSYPSNRYILPAHLHQFTKNISLKRGEAIFYSDKLFHGSHANNGNDDRIIVTGRVMEKNARLVYFHKANEKEANVYLADSKFYLTHIDSIAKGQVPADIPKLYTRPYEHIEVTDQALQAKIYENFIPVNNKHLNMDCQLFKQAQLQATFEKDGYVIIDFIDEEQVKSLLGFYNNLENAPVPEFGFQVSLDNNNPEFVRNVSEKLISVVHSNVEKFFTNHRIFTASFVVKEKSAIGIVPPHQDWTFVDENNYWSATIWCPLVNVTMDNGGLGLIKGSHLFYDHVRPSPSPQYEPPFKDQLSEIFPYLNIIDLKAGQALVFNNQTIHGSPPNMSDHTRVSFGIGITHKDAAIQHYYKLPDTAKNLIEGYEVNADFFFSYNNARLSSLYANGKKPSDLNSIGTFAYKCNNFSSAELIEKIEMAGNKINEPLKRKISPILGNPNKAEKNIQEQNVFNPGNNNRSFWKIYTPANIFREIKYRISKR